MLTLVLHRVPARVTPLASWLGPEVGKRCVLLTTRSLEREYAGWARQTYAFDHYETNAAVEHQALRLAQEEPIERVVALSEYDLVRAAELRERLGLPGQSAWSARAFRDKCVMKGLVRVAGIEVPVYRPLSSAFDLLDFGAEHGFPLVVKPRDGAGSVDTFVLQSEGDLAAWLDRPSPVWARTMVERFVEGEMYHVDGFLHRGELRIVEPSRYVVGCLAFQRGESLKSVQVVADGVLRERLATFAERVLSALPAPATAAFHLEVFRTLDDRLVFCEIASRIGGGRILDVIEFTYGINVVEVLLKLEFGVFADLPACSRSQRVYAFALIPPRVGILETLPEGSRIAGARLVDVHCQAGQRLEAATSSVSAMASIVVEGETESEVEIALNQAVVDFESGCRFRREDGETTPDKGEMA